MDDAQKAEADYKKELEAGGVELPTEDAPKEPVVEPKEEAPKEPEPEPKEPEKPKTEEEPRVERKRSIYDDYKDKKSEVRAEKEAREQAERERDELKARLDAFSEANSPQEKKDAASNAVEYATEVGADPELVRRIIDEARTNQPQIDPTIAERLDKFENWQKQNSHAMEKQAFDDEFAQATPSLKAMFPNANAEEFGALKSELDKLSHSKGMHDKELDYVAFKNREHLSAFVSPQKRGMESKGRNQVEDNSFEFDAGADISKMGVKERDAWEATYHKSIEDAGGINGTGKNKILL